MRVSRAEEEGLANGKGARGAREHGKAIARTAPRHTSRAEKADEEIGRRPRARPHNRPKALHNANRNLAAGCAYKKGIGRVIPNAEGPRQAAEGKSCALTMRARRKNPKSL